MIEITVPPFEFFDEKSGQFIENKKAVKIQLEHSLISISKWESKYHKPFLSDDDMTTEEAVEYIKFMTLNKGVDPLAYLMIPAEEMQRVNEYIKDPQTATTINDTTKSKKEVITSEIIYYWMISYNIPVDFEKWHLNRLMTLIRVCSIKADPNPKKMSKNQIRQQNAALNAARRKKLNSKG